ncbi:hypothetical protein [Mycobacterium sp.]|uniref:hypothetical protein n=1 Tax=Mycobacterium sp. TaxID=1785 RepID=UPI003F9E83CC
MTVEPVVNAEIVDLTEDEATKITGRIRTWVKAFPAEDVKRAYFGRIWLPMGYDSWAEWCDCELGGFKLPIEERRAVVTGLAESGMSNRAIGAVTGVDKNTVRSDLAKAGGENSPTAPRAVTGPDGKTYNNTPKPEPRADSPPTAAPRTDLDELGAFLDHLKSAIRCARKIASLDDLDPDTARSYFDLFERFHEEYDRVANGVLFRVSPYVGRRLE